MPLWKDGHPWCVLILFRDGLHGVVSLYPLYQQRAVHLDAYIVTGQMPACFSRSTTTLEELSVGSDLALSWLKGPYMHDLIQNSQLKCIRVRDARHKAEILELLKSPSAASERLETLIVFPEDELSYPR